MALDPKAVHWARCEFMQVQTTGDLPALNGSGSPMFGTFCWVSDTERMWSVIHDASDPKNLNMWAVIPIGSSSAATTQNFVFSVPSAGTSVIDQTINGSVVTDPSADEYRIRATYQPGFQLQPNASLAAFQYATFLLIDPSLLAEGRRIVVINTGDPEIQARQSSIALRLPNGSTSRINYYRPDISFDQNLTSGQYLIVQAGGAVTLSVDRSDPATPRYWIINHF